MKGIFRSLKTRNYRLYFFGQVVSLIGTWMQIIANTWLVLQLTGSGTQVGLASALQFGPMLLGSFWGGLVADRIPKRRLLIITQSLFLLQACAVGTLVATGVLRLWMLYSLIVAYGIVQIFDVPARQAFVSEMVAQDDVMNAVGLNSAVFNGARLIGPTLAAILIKEVSMATAFFVNAGTYFAVLVALLLMRERDLFSHQARAPHGRGQIRAALQYVRETPVLLWSLVMMAVAGTLSLNFQIIVPLLTKFTFHRDITTFGLFTATMGIGSFIGAMYAASRKIPSLKLLTISCAGFGATMIGVALTPTMSESYVSLALVGLAAMIFISTSNTVLQLRAAPEMRGRVLALWSLVFLGSTPIGGPFIGWVSQHWSPRVGFMVGGVPTLAVALILGPLLLRRERAETAKQAEIEPAEAELEAVATE